MENRELGARPKRTHHCMNELLRIPLGNWEGAYSHDFKPGDLPTDDLMNEGKVHYLLTLMPIWVLTLVSNGLFLLLSPN